MNAQICSKCLISKPHSEFNKSSKRKLGIRPDCKSCRKAESALRYAAKSDELKEYASNYRSANPDTNRAYYEANQAYFEAYRLINKPHYKQWRKDNRDKLKEYKDRKILSDPSFRMACSLRSNLSTRIRLAGTVKSGKTIDLLGCTFDEFKTYMEGKFTGTMSWSNYGEWHIDHIKPCASFDLTKPEEQALCFHYTNMQPLWAEENIKKGSKYKHGSTI